MVPCVIMGDSIAVGVGMYRPDCETVARSGITSERYVNTMFAPQDAQTIIISLGVNDDGRTIDTLGNLRRMRAGLRGQTVYWLLPGIREWAREAIRTVATEFGDRLIDTRGYTGRDHLHPTGTGYQTLASLTEDGGSSFVPRYAMLEPSQPEVYTQVERRPVVVRWQMPARHRHYASYARWNHRYEFRLALGDRPGPHGHAHYREFARLDRHGFATLNLHPISYRLVSYRLALLSPAGAGRFMPSFVPAERGAYARHMRYSAVPYSTGYYGDSVYHGHIGAPHLRAVTYRMLATLPHTSSARFQTMPLPPRERSTHAISGRPARQPGYMRVVTCFRRAASACLAVFRPERG